MQTKIQVQVEMKPTTQQNDSQAETMKMPSDSRRDSSQIHYRSNGSVTPIKAAPYNTASSSSEVPQDLVSKDFTTRGGPAYESAKRIFDLLVASIMLAIALPIILSAALAIRWETPGSPFFIQTRLGRNGKPFKIVKLRGMFIDARTRFSNYYDYSNHKDLEFCFHHEEDPRVTGTGRFIRRTSIDELPNLLNVVIGDMSLVGPRPEIPEVLRLYGHYRSEYLSVKPGVTCISKCTGRDRLTKKETIEFDLGYIRNRSFRMDVSILWKTFRGVLLRRDVF